MINKIEANEGNYYYSADFEVYQGLLEPHCDRGLAYIYWDKDLNRFNINIVTVFFPSNHPEKLMAAIAFEGYFEAISIGEISNGDKIYLNYLSRIGIGYASQGIKKDGKYSWSVTKLTKTHQGNIQEINIRLSTGKTLGNITLQKVIT